MLRILVFISPVCLSVMALYVICLRVICFFTLCVLGTDHVWKNVFDTLSHTCKDKNVLDISLCEHV